MAETTTDKKTVTVTRECCAVCHCYRSGYCKLNPPAYSLAVKNCAIMQPTLPTGWCAQFQVRTDWDGYADQPPLLKVPVELPRRA